MATVTRKSLLLIGIPEAIVDSLKQPLIEKLADKLISPILVFARDGADGGNKFAKQKFDFVVIDLSTSRLRESGIAAALHSTKGAGTSYLLIQPEEMTDLPTDWKNSVNLIKKPYQIHELVLAMSQCMLAPAKVESSSAATAPARFAVDVRVLNAILKATMMICKQFGLSQIQLQKPQMKALGLPWKGDIAGSIAIESQIFKGALVISFDRDLYLQMVSTMLGEEQKEICDDNRDAIGEISNMILGNAKSDFTQYGIGMTLPKILQPGEPFVAPAGSASMVLSGSTDVGQIYLEVIAYSSKAA